MPHIIVIDKSGTIKSTNVKEVSAENMYRKAGLKSGENFKLQHTWGKSDGLDCNICIYAKTSPSRAGQENKYDFPPPVDNTLFFGSCVLVRKNIEMTEVLDLGESDWNEIYDKLFGGFEDIGSNSDEESESESESEVDMPKTKQNYVKDGFVVDDDECEEEEYSSSEEEEKEIKPVRKTKQRKQPTVIIPTVNTSAKDDFDDELVEEDYW